MELKKYIGSSKSLIRLCICALVFFYFCISCSNSSKIPVNEKSLNKSDEAIKIELNLIEDCLREFIIFNKEKPAIRDYRLTLKALEGGYLKIKKDIWGVGDFVIQKNGTRQELVANYSLVSADGSHSDILIIILHKQNGVYKVKGFSSEELFDIEEIIE